MIPSATANHSPFSAYYTQFRHTMPVASQYASFSLGTQPFEYVTFLSDTSDIVKVDCSRLTSSAKRYIENKNSGLSEQQRLANAEKEALAFLTLYPSIQSALKALKAMGVTVLDGSRPELYDIFKIYQSAAIFMPPNALQSVDGQWPFGGPSTQIPASLIKEMRKAEVIGSPILLTAKNNPITQQPYTENEQHGILAHEIFHFFQFINGLSFSQGNHSIMVEANKQKVALLSHVTAPKSSKTYWQFRLIDPFRAQFFKMQAKLAPRQAFPSPSKEMQMVFQRELEAHHFIGKNARALGLPPFKTWWDNMKFQRVYNRLFNLSYAQKHQS